MLYKKIIATLVFVFSSCFNNALLAAMDGVYPLSIFESTTSTDDLKPFGKIVDQTSVVGLGETVHTSGGYYQAKFRLIKYLVGEKGFRLFGMETPWITALTASGYVDHCTGTPTNAVKSVFRVFQDQSTQDLLAWLCRYNAEHQSDPVVFFGYDTQEVETFGVIFNAISDFRLDPAGALSAALSQCAGAKFKSTPEFWSSSVGRSIRAGTPIPSSSRQQCASALSQVDQLSRKLPPNVPAWRKFLLQRAAFSALAFQKQLELTSDSSGQAASLIRDQAMATNFRALHAWLGINKKAINWAASYHLAKSSFKDRRPDGSKVEFKVMGVWLREIYGSSYEPFHISGYQVLINWPNGPTYPEYPANTATLETSLHERGFQNAFVDFAGSWLMPNIAYFMRDGDRIVPAAYFRGMFYLDKSRGNIYP